MAHQSDTFMATFFQPTAQEHINQLIDRFPLMKIDQVLDWTDIDYFLQRQKALYLRDNRGRPAYSLLLFKAILLGQWHDLSDPEPEKQADCSIGF